MKNECVVYVCKAIFHLPWFYTSNLIGCIREFEYKRQVKFSREECRYIMIKVIKAWDVTQLEVQNEGS